MKITRQVVPSLLSMNLACMRRELEKIPESVKMLHLDVMDGHFVKNITFGCVFLENLRPLTARKIDAHLMISNPDRYAPEFVRAGADLVSFHPETSSNPAALIKKIRGDGALAGIALNPDVSEKKYKNLIKLADYVLVMSVFPGFAGQKFMPEVLEKVVRLKKMRNKTDFAIEIDGGINEETGRTALKAGTDWIVSGSYLFKGGRIKQKIERILS